MGWIVGIVLAVLVLVGVGFYSCCANHQHMDP